MAKTKKVVITGGTGFVGSNLCRRSLALGYETHLLVRDGFDSWRIRDVLSDLQIHYVDFLDVGTIKEALREIRPDWIFHLAAHGAYSFQNNVEEIFNTNFRATHNLVEAAIEVGFDSFVNTGSSSEYGYKNDQQSEDDVLEPNSYYSVSKAASTLYCSFVAKNKNLRMPTLRLYSVYGKYEDPRRLMPTLILKALENQYPPLVSQVTVRDFISVDDVVDAYFLAAEKGTIGMGEILNVSSGQQTSIGELVGLVKSQFSISGVPVWGDMPSKAWDTTCWVGCNDRIRKALGWSPRISLPEGLENLADWFRTDLEIRSFYSMKE